jgi:drug/metabolite transporter (DMT)-like permease
MLQSHQQRIRLAPLALIALTAAWGISFVIMKDAIERQSVNSFLFTRFGLAVLVLFVMRPSVLRKIDKDLFLKAFTAGLVLGAGFILQTEGLARTGAAVTGFITGLYVVATPVISALFLKKKISLFTWLCVALATLGLAVLSLRGWTFGFGEFLVLLCAIAFAVHIILLGQWSSGRDVYAMTLVQLLAVTFLTGIFAFIEGYEAPPDNGVWGVVIFTAIAATALGFIIQTWAQAYIDTTKVAVILTLEVVFAALFAFTIGEEKMTIQIALGGLMLLTAMYLIVLKDASVND